MVNGFERTILNFLMIKQEQNRVEGIRTVEEGATLAEIMHHVEGDPEIIKSRNNSNSYPSRAQKDKVRRILNNSIYVYHNGKKTHKKRYLFSDSLTYNIDSDVHSVSGLMDQIFICNELLGGSAPIDHIASLMKARSGFNSLPGCTYLPEYLWDYDERESFWPKEYRAAHPVAINSPSADFYFHLVMSIMNNNFPFVDLKWDTTFVKGLQEKDRIRTPITSAHLDRHNIDILEIIRNEEAKITGWHSEHWFKKNNDFLPSSYYGFQSTIHLKEIIRNINTMIAYIDENDLEIPESIKIKKEIKWLLENKREVRVKSSEKQEMDIGGKNISYTPLNNKTIFTLAILNLNRSLYEHYPMIPHS